MECRDCGTENSSRTFYCGGCGRPLGMGPDATILAATEPGMDDVPAPGASREAVATTGERALCSLCLGAFPSSDLSYVEGRAYCHDCSPVKGSRSDWQAPVETFEAPEQCEPQARFAPPPPPRPARSGQAILLGGLTLLLAAGAVLAYVSLSGGSSRINKLLSGVDSSRTESVLLLPQYHAGDHLEYRMSVEGTMDMSGKGNMPGQSMEMNAELGLSGDMRLDVEGVDDGGNADLLLELSNMKMDVTGDLGGKPLPLPNNGDLGSCSIRMTVDRNGRAVGDSVEVNGSMPFTIQPEQMATGGMEGLPTGPVKVGDTWSASMGADDLGNIPGGPMNLGGMQLLLTYEVVGFKTIRNRDCVVIRVDGDMDMDQGSLDMEGVVFMDVQKRQLVRMALDMVLDMNVSMPQGSLEAGVDLRMDIELF